MKMEQFIKGLAIKIKEKPELKGISDEVVTNLLKAHLKKTKISLKDLNSKDLKIILSQIRAELRNLTGQYQKKILNREELLDSKRISELLMTHSSTAERISFYPALRKKINSLNIRSILDLGCGINPLALASSDITYYASDITESDLSLIKSYFSRKKINGRTFVYDLRNPKGDLPKADLCLLFKVLDIIEKKSHKLAEEIIKRVPCKYLIVSFATRKLSGRPMVFPKRKWFEKLSQRLGYRFESFNSDNEVFYIVRKSP